MMWRVFSLSGQRSIHESLRYVPIKLLAESDNVERFVIDCLLLPDTYCMCSVSFTSGIDDPPDNGVGHASWIK
jgi:hypothetical protein